MPSVWPYVALLAVRLAWACALILRNALPNAPSSIGSPSGVPVPWQLKRTMRGFSDALAAVRRSTSCAGPFGAVRLLDLPSWFTAVPKMTERISSLEHSPSATTTVPSPRPYPSAMLSKVLHRPSAASAPSRAIPS